jgi:sulfur carrier protein
VKATINGKVRDLPNELTIGSMLDLLGSARLGVAVARNDCVVRKDDYETQTLRDGDRIEIIAAVAGG